MERTEVEELIQFIEEETEGITLASIYKRVIDNEINAALNGDKYSCYGLSAIAISIIVAKAILKKVNIEDQGAILANYCGRCDVDEVKGFIELKLSNVEKVILYIHFMINPSTDIDNILETCTKAPFSIILKAPGIIKNRTLTGTQKKVVNEVVNVIHEIYDITDYFKRLTVYYATNPVQA